MQSAHLLPHALDSLGQLVKETYMPVLAAFWIVVYCAHVGRCDVYKADDGIAVKQFSTQQACKDDMSSTVHQNSKCISVNSVSCYKGGSACTFDPADDDAWKLVNKMVPLPQ